MIRPTKYAGLRRFLLILLCVASLVGCNKSSPWLLMNVSGHLPDLDFALTSDTGKAVTAQDYRGKVVILYFGYTHCPDVCPITMARLSETLQKLGNQARNVRILFVSVDPKRDAPTTLHSYVMAFDPSAVGLTGLPKAIETLTKRYRVAYQAQPANASGNYDVAHGSAVYIFDKSGHARLLASSDDTIDSISHDVHLLLQSSF